MDDAVEDTRKWLAEVIFNSLCMGISTERKFSGFVCL